jgi:hypothetical protein
VRARAQTKNGNRKFGKSREYCAIDGTDFHIWGFGRGGFLSAGKLSTANIFGLRRVCHSVLPKRAYKIVVDGIESDSFHLDIENDWFLVHEGLILNVQAEYHFPEKGDREKALNSLSGFDCDQPS